MIKELILLQQICPICVSPPTWPPPVENPQCGPVSQVPAPWLCRQNNAPYFVDGCSIPQQITNALFGGNRNNPVGGTAGLIPTTFGKDQGWVSNAATISALPCNQHDKCYKTCNSGKAVCDEAFRVNLTGVCISAYPHASICPWNFPPRLQPAKCPVYFAEEALCRLIKDGMAGAVDIAGGQAYTSNQNRHCECCNP